MRGKGARAVVRKGGRLVVIGFLTLQIAMPAHAAGSKQGKPHITADGTKFERGVHALDGMDCRDCVFHDVTLTYSGGVVHLVNPRFEGNVSVEFKGPAQNTRDLLQFIEAMATTMPPRSQFESKMTSKVVIGKNKRSGNLILNASPKGKSVQ
ncbi:hypothetical protein W02_42450 [Nitrospira sp. KM1]|uniref:hypothetical protein n=1 Tax=Nitrospira sp. KM1 TaxID=1936990 RepID=UPI0013A7ADAA|nr:hypothetical protein [Nitrospira sp. KM1]BCA57105.1 hypothetical protein W02_42450 [Nitrospira sp. KM1]